MIATEEHRFATPWGDGRLAFGGGRLLEVDLPVPNGPLPAVAKTPADLASRPAKDAADRATSDGFLDGAARWAAELEGFFAGGRRSWTAQEIRLDDLPVSPFARDVYRALLDVSAGETVSYGELAVLAGHAGAARAVGSAMAANPLALVIPCHRVVRSDGTSGRYGQCDELKPYLLRLEGAL